MSMDIKAFRDELVSARALASQQEIKITEAKKEIGLFLSSLSSEDIDRLESYGIFFRDLLRFNLDQVFSDKGENERFQQSYNKVMGEIRELIERERGALLNASNNKLWRS